MNVASRLRKVIPICGLFQHIINSATPARNLIHCRSGDPMPSQPEAFSRVLIDEALRDSGWDLYNPQQMRFELSGANGRADYVLSGLHGPLCVLEAKKEDVDP